MLSSAGKKQVDTQNIEISLDLRMVTVSTQGDNEDEAQIQFTKWMKAMKEETFLKLKNKDDK